MGMDDVMIMPSTIIVQPGIWGEPSQGFVI